MLYILHLTEEAEVILNNLIPYFQYKFGDNTLLYFTKSTKNKAKKDRSDAKKNRVVYATDLYLEEEEVDKLGFKEAKSFIGSQKERIALAKNLILIELNWE